MNETAEITEAPKDCGDSGSIWATGKSLFKYDFPLLRSISIFIDRTRFNQHDIIIRFIREQVLLDGTTGKVAFDDNGDRIFAEYDIVNIKENGTPVSVGQYFHPVVRKIEKNNKNEHFTFKNEIHKNSAFT